MDVDILSGMIKELVAAYDNVTLPGLGSFVAELVPATFTDRGYTIQPPYRKLYFSPRQGEDTLLVSMYAASKGGSEASAALELTEFLMEMKEVLKEKKSIILPGLGRLRATKENHFFFVPDEDLDIYPDGFGLEPVSLKSHSETSSQQTPDSQSVQANQPISKPLPIKGDAVAPDDKVDNAHPDTVPTSQPINEDEGEPDTIPTSQPIAKPLPINEDDKAPDVEPDTNTENAAVTDNGPTDTTPAPVTDTVPADADTPTDTTPDTTPAKPSGWKTFGKVILWILIIAVVAAVAIAVIGRVAPEFADRFLYSEEELRILYGR